MGNVFEWYMSIPCFHCHTLLELDRRLEEADCILNAFKVVDQYCKSRKDEKENETERTFLNTLREKIRVATDGHLGKILDVFHHPEVYYEIESIINYCIDYFLKEAQK